jgi:ComF family protein
MGAFICGLCSAGMQPAAGQRCPVCWLGGAEDRCPRCRYDRPAFRAARSVFVYDKEKLAAYRHDGAVRSAVHALKYRGVSAVASVMAAPMAELLAKWSPDVAAIVPVPLFGARRRLRGYNQSELLARGVARLTGLPLETKVLHRRRATPPQVRQPDEESRRSNLDGAFAADGRRAEGRSFLLIDDVMTTGATLDACARVLMDAGSGAVFALTFARED